MPLTYPPAGPTVSGDITSIHHLLTQPALVTRRLLHRLPPDNGDNA